MSRSWWMESEGFFDDLYLSTLRDGIHFADGELDFYSNILTVRPPARILDLGGGWGRLTVPLARSGYRCTVLDTSVSFLEHARVSAREADIPLTTMHGDMRTWTATGFDALVSNSIGYFESDDDYEAVFARCANALVAGGEFLLDLQNWEHVRRHFVPVEDRRTRFGMVRRRRVLDPDRKEVLETVIREFADGTSRCNQIRVRFFGDDIVGRLTGVGFHVRAVYGDYVGGRHTEDSPRRILHAWRIA